MIVNVNPAQEINIVVQSLLDLRGDRVAFHHRQRAVNADDEVDHQVRPKTVGLSFFDLLHARHGCQQFQ